MSFSLRTKAELCQAPLQKTCCLVAEALGILLYCNTFSATEVQITTLSEDFAKRLPPLFKKAFGISFDSLSTGSSKQKFGIHGPEKLEIIFQILGYPQDMLSCHINFSLLEEPCCAFSFCRGAFLAGGSVSDPQKNYHLELTTSHFHVSRELPALLHEHQFQVKSSQRKGHYISYFKQSEHIEDFLTSMGASNGAMELMNVKLEKNLTSSINRVVNCDSANLGKAVNAAQDQIQAIRLLEKEGILQQLPEKLQETARLRCAYPHCTLTELSEFFTPPLSKSALNHRLRKLNALATQKE